MALADREMVPSFGAQQCMGEISEMRTNMPALPVPGPVEVHGMVFCYHFYTTLHTTDRK
jgi:hypothetical protein